MAATLGADRYLTSSASSDRGIGRKGIGAAGIEEYDRHPGIGFELMEKAVQRHELTGGIIECRDIGIDGHQIILAAGFDAVARVIDERHVGIACIFG